MSSKEERDDYGAAHAAVADAWRRHDSWDKYQDAIQRKHDAEAKLTPDERRAALS
jgi:hypothetical protein